MGHCTSAAYLDGKHDIDCPDDIILLGVDRPCSINHGVGGAPLLSKVHHGIWLEAGEDLFQEPPVTDVPYLQLNVLA